MRPPLLMENCRDPESIDLLAGCCPCCTIRRLCAQTCLTDGSGELLCRNWAALAVPGQLGKMKKPWTDLGVDYTQTDVGSTHACAVTSERDIWCWGMNDFGQFGTDALSSTDTLEPNVRITR